jgi:type II secretory pathway component PulF
LHRAGVAWPEALASATGGDPRWAPARRAVAGGAPLSEAVAAQVGALDRALLRAAEATGTIEETLERIATRREDETRRRRERQAALLYPLVLAHVAAALAAVPDLVAGRPLLALGWVAAVLVPLHVGWWLARTGAARAARPGHPAAGPPRARGLARNRVEEADARALLALGDAYDAGLPLEETLTLAAQAGAGGRVAFDLRHALPRVHEGEPLAAAWHALPPDLAADLRSAEESGEVGRAARRQAGELAFRVAMRRKKAAALLPVVLVLLVGALVAWRVISFYRDFYGNLGLR